MSTRDLNTLYEMLSFKRPHQSATEAEFVRRWIGTMPGIGYDKFGNAMLRIGTAPVLWSCHTDTVHHKDGMQNLEVFKHKGRPEFVALAKKDQSRGNCLGADDGAGVWLMWNMIRARVPGLYVFHAGEEHGGLGSQHIAKNERDLLKGLDFAIAFDRKGTQDVITHQMGQMTCSDKFATQLARKLGGGYRPDSGGVFTDTLHYADHIAECTNISVGYEDAHSHKESLDLAHLLDLRDTLCAFDLSDLKASRYPGEDDPVWVDELHTPLRKAANTNTYDETLTDLVTAYPEVAAEVIRQLGGNAQDMLDQLDLWGFDTRELVH